MKSKTVVILLLLSVLLVCSCQNISEEIRTDGTDVQNEISEVTEEYQEHENPNAIHIGVSMQGLQRPYIKRVRDVLLSVEKRYEGQIKLTILDGQEDAERQNAQIERLITQKVDAIIFNPISYEEGKIGIQLANNNNIPIIMLITLANGSLNNAQAFAVSDHVESAYIQIEMAAEYLNGKGNIAILKGKRGVNSEIDRTKGYETKLQEYPGITVKCSQVANWSEDEAREIVENWIRTGKEIDAILAQNDIMAIGALEAVQNAGKLDEIAVFGIDGDRESLILIKNGKLQGTVYHDAVTQGRLAVEYAIELAKGNSVPFEYIPFKPVTKENVESFLLFTENL